MTFTTQTLGEICDQTNGLIRTGPFGSQLHESDYINDGLPVVMPKNIIEGKVSTADIARIGEADSERLGQHKMQKGDIVYGRRGDIGRRALITERENGWLCGTGCLRISLGNKVLYPPFLYYYLGEPKIIAWIFNQAVGATLPNLNTEILRNVKIKYPPLATQRKIAAILSAYDDLIENNARRIAILEDMARSLYREWFVHFRFPGHENVPIVDGVPEGWEHRKIQEIAAIYRGKSYKSTDLTEEGGLPFLNLKCIERGGGFRRDGIKAYQGTYKQTQTAKAGDIILAVTDMTQERRLVAHAARVPHIDQELSVFSMDLVKAEPSPTVAKDYLYGMFRFSGFADEVKQHANGANVLHLNPERIENYRFALPPENLRNSYAFICSGIYKQCDVLHLKNANLRHTRDLLLPKLISGELDVEDLDITGAQDL